MKQYLIILTHHMQNKNNNLKQKHNTQINSITKTNNLLQCHGNFNKIKIYKNFIQQRMNITKKIIT